jgi:hypothetical protein
MLLQFMHSTTFGVVPFPLLCSEASLEDAPSGPGSPHVPDNASMLDAPDGSQDDAVAKGDLGENRGPEPDLWLQV